MIFKFGRKDIKNYNIINYFWHVPKGQLCYISGAKIKDEKGVPELQIIISYNQPEKAQKIYKERWQIETAFKGLKSSGFNIEDTHLTDIARIEKLFYIVLIAFAWSYTRAAQSASITGVYTNDNIKPIRILKNGRRAKSFLKYGLETISRIFLNPLAKPEFDIFKLLIPT